MSTPPEDVTRLLHAWSDGDADSAELLVPLIYDELRSLAARYLAGERPGHWRMGHWRMAKAWLYSELSQRAAEDA